MRSRIPLLLAAFALALAAGGCAQPDTQRTDERGTDERRHPIEAYLDATWPEGAGGTVLTARDGELVTCQGLGMADRQARIPAGCDTVYDIGSITKSFTAVAVLTLQMRGELDVTDPVTAYLGPAPDDKAGITLHHLLTHTSGLPEAVGDDYDPMTRDELVAAAMDAELVSEPGAAYHYSNTGYSLLAAIIEKVSGMGYEEYLAERLFAPAGMTRTGYVLPAWEPGTVAVEYDRHGTPHGRPFDHPWAEDGPHWNLRGNGGLLSTAEDMLRWYRALQDDTLLDQHAKDLMFDTHVRQPHQEGIFYGYGWSVGTVDGHGRIATHNGGNDWSLSRYFTLPDDGVMVFWASNRAYRDGQWNLGRRDAEMSLRLAELTRAGAPGADRAPTGSRHPTRR
jgi:CubicO group peptidase (beta-lactamase class C family)